MIDQTPLGKPTEYLDQYEPALLVAIARDPSRESLGLTADLPFGGVDIWNAWEISWLNPHGVPQLASAEIRVPADSPQLVESKSLKLYLGSFAMTRQASQDALQEAIVADLSACVQSPVTLQWHTVRADSAIASLPGRCVDDSNTQCDTYHPDPELLQCGGDVVAESLHSHQLRSLCPVTNQPDIGSVLVSYRGPRIDPASLLRYIVSFRQHNDFHEACVEQMFADIAARCGTEQLSVYARYQRRGGIDINPFRSDFETDPPNLRLPRQ